MRTLFLLFCLLLAATLHAQTQGDVEKGWIANVFATKYKPRVQPQVRDMFQRNGNVLTYTNGYTLTLHGTSADLLPLLEDGRFNNRTLDAWREPLAEPPLDSSTLRTLPAGKTLSDVLNFSSFWYGTLGEVAGPLPDTVRRYRFLAGYSAMANPRLYVLELRNPHGNREQSQQDFIAGAVVTFCWQVSILI